MTPKLGDYGVVPMSGTVGGLIRVGQWLNGDGFADYQHAVLYVGGGHIVEAEPGGALLSPWDKYGDAILWSTDALNPTDEQREAIARAGLRYVGVPYSFADYAAIAAHRLHAPGSRLLKNYVASTTHMICSQLVDQSYCDGGYHIFNDGRWPGYVTPLDLAKVARKSPTTVFSQ